MQTTTAIHVVWTEPDDHGKPIDTYYLRVDGETHTLSPDALQYLMVGGVPGSSHTVAVRAKNFTPAVEADYEDVKEEVSEVMSRLSKEYPGAVIFEELNVISMHGRGQLWRHADVAVFTPIREGVNAWPFEAIFARRDGTPGVTILSEFASCSLEAIALEEALKAAGKEAPAACVRVAQMGEKTKLNMTCTLQVLRKRALENAWSWQTAETDGSPDGPGSIDVAELERREASFAAAARPPPTVAAPSFANGNFRKACAEHDGRKMPSLGCQGTLAYTTYDI